MTRAGIALSALACAALIAHLLFIPYAFSPLSLADAVRAFGRIPWMRLGSDQNVALVSRALMFLPLGLLLAASVAPRPRRGFEAPALLVAVVLGCGWAILVNVAQFWFPTRTVSLNNLAAEFAGVAVGGLLWAGLGATALRWWRQLESGGRISIGAALTGYVVAYLAASLAPFDFVTNLSELEIKASSNLHGLWLAPISCGVAPCELKFLVLTLATIPCGWWFAAHSPTHRARWISSILVGFVVAACIELLHFLMVSGVSQGASVITRTAGMVIGTLTFPLRGRVWALGRVSRLAVAILIAPYLVVLAYVAGWFRAPKLDFSAGLARVGEIVWLPFYYQYYSPYQSTMQSTIVHAALYAAVGAACWLWAKQRDRVPIASGAVIAAVLAFAAETSKIFLADRLPDYTDVLIAAVASASTLAVFRFLSRGPPSSVPAGGVRVHERTDAPLDIDGEAAAPPGQAGSPAIGMLLVGIAFLVIAVLSVVRFPVGTTWLSVGFLAYGALLLRYPLAYLILIPPLLLVLDLAPFTGRLFWDELDIVLAVTAGVRLLSGHLRVPPGVPLPKPGFGLLALSIIASTAIGLWPPGPLDANAFSSYLSTYNALRVGKGYAWAALVLWLFRRDADWGGKAVHATRVGLGLALFAAAISVLLERVTFVDWRDLDTSFRASGFMSATHVGGAYMEAALVMLTPFGLALALDSNRRLHAACWYGVVLLAGVALYATLSRAALAAWPITIATFASVWWLKSRASVRSGVATRTRWSTWAILLAVVTTIPVLASQSTQLRDRLLSSSTDLSTRMTHWSETADLIQAKPLHLIAGAGLGRFPREFYLAYAGEHLLPAYRLDTDPASRSSYLALSGGPGMYIDQRVPARSGAELRLAGRIRASGPGATLWVSLCDKSFLNSVRCEETTVKAAPDWQNFEVLIRSPQRARANLMPGSTIALSLHNATFGSRIDVSALSLHDGERELLQNGSFERDLDHWLMTSDVHLAWRALSTPIQVVFEQGALGLLAWALLLARAFSLLLRRDGTPGPNAAFAAALVGFLVVGGFDSLLDSPRIILLLLLMYAAYLGSWAIPKVPGIGAAPRPQTLR